MIKLPLSYTSQGLGFNVHQATFTLQVSLVVRIFKKQLRLSSFILLAVFRINLGQATFLYEYDTHIGLRQLMRPDAHLGWVGTKSVCAS